MQNSHDILKLEDRYNKNIKQKSVNNMNISKNKKIKSVPKSTYKDATFIRKSKEYSLNPKKDISQGNILDNKDKQSNIQVNEIIAKYFNQLFDFCNIESTLYIWDSDTGLYKLFSNEFADRFIRTNTPEKYRYKINKSTISEIIQWIKAPLKEFTFENINSDKERYIPFQNGIFDLNEFTLIDYSSKLFFTSSISAIYDPNTKESGENFEQFLYDITQGDDDFYARIQELFGYVISEVRNLKYIPFLVGPKDTGKSIILTLLEQLIGKESYSNLSFEQLNQPEYLAQIIGKKLNSCAEASEVKLSRLDNFKKLSGGDTLTARPLYGFPISFVNTAVLLFAGNHLPKLKNIDRSNAFSQRLVIFPFYNQIPREKQDPFLLDKILEEKAYIINWAIQGFLKWRDQNYIFTDVSGIAETQKFYESNNNSIESFISERCSFDSNSRIHKLELYEHYKNYCEENNLITEKLSELHNFLVTYKNISVSRFRLNGNNTNGYIGMTIYTEKSEE